MGLRFRELAQTAARLAREGWTPPPPVDPDVLAYREWELSKLENAAYREAVLAGRWDRSVTAIGFIAGHRMAREQEQERAKLLVKYVAAHAKGVNITMMPAAEALAAYRAGRAAR